MPTSKRTFDTLSQYVLKMPLRKKPHCLGVFNRNGSLTHFSSHAYFDQIQKLAKALVASGVKKGTKVGLLSNTRHEWSVCDLASICVGAVVVPLYPNMTTEDLAYILNHSECELVFVENRLTLRQIMVVREKCPKLKSLVVFDPPQQQEPGLWMSFNEFVSGSAQSEHHSFNFEKQCQQAQASDPVTIIYTSGTTGQPKGVLLTHSQIINVTIEAFAALQITEDDHTLSFLPYSHVLGRTEHWGQLIVGYSMTYSSGVEKLADELPIVNPTVIVAVPRIFEKIYTSLKTKIDTSSVDSSLFNWAFKIGNSASEKIQKNDELGLKLKAELLLANSVLFDRLKTQLFGSRLRFAVSGGAPLSAEIIRFFHACGILILEGYGLTETTGAICVNRPYDFGFGTVGKPLNKTKIKIAADGEILVQGPMVMKEYFNDARSTQTIFQNNWIHTGDIGEITPEGRLVIKDRKKDLIKTANGKYVAPQKLEGLFKQLPFISHAHIHGDLRKYVVALLTLNKNYLFSEAREKGISFKSLEDLKENSYIKEMIRSGVAEINSHLAAHETIKNYSVLTEDFSIESGEVTPSLKVKRRVIDKKYKVLIDSLYD